jgi:20S proteasome alpha/beta subunit
MTLCVAAACQERGKPRIVIATDWKAGIQIATAEIQDKLFWIDDNIPVLVAGTVSRARELVDTYRQYFKVRKGSTDTLKIDPHNIIDSFKQPIAAYKAKRANEYVSLKFGIDYETFRVAAGKDEIPSIVTTQTFHEISQIELGCSLILVTFLGSTDTCIYRIDDDGEVESCDNFAAIGTGSIIAQSALYHRQQEARMTLGQTVYHVFEAMKLGSIASDVGERHTINVLYPAGEKAALKKGVTGFGLKDSTEKFLEGQYRRYGPKLFKRLVLPRNPFERDF